MKFTSCKISKINFIKALYLTVMLLLGGQPITTLLAVITPDNIPVNLNIAISNLYYLKGQDYKLKKYSDIQFIPKYTKLSLKNCNTVASRFNCSVKSVPRGTLCETFIFTGDIQNLCLLVDNLQQDADCYWDISSFQTSFDTIDALNIPYTIEYVIPKED